MRKDSGFEQNDLGGEEVSLGLTLRQDSLELGRKSEELPTQQSSGHFG